MAKGAYVGISGTAHKVKNIYVGINNVAHKVIKGYVGVNGVAQQFWPIGDIPIVSNSWDYWSSVSGRIFVNYSFSDNNPIMKVNNKICYFGLCRLLFGSTPRTGIIIMSPNADAVVVETKYGGTFYYTFTVVDRNNITWYVNFMNDTNRDYTYEYFINDTVYHFYSPDERPQAARDLLDRIYAVPFHENYQVGQTYNNATIYYSDIEKILRKAIGIMLFRNVASYGNIVKYTEFSDNAQTIISNLLTSIGTDNFITISISDVVTNNYDLNISIGHPYNYPVNFIISSLVTQNGFEYYYAPQNVNMLGFDVVTINRHTGDITYTRSTPSSTISWRDNIIGIDLVSNSSLKTTNMGLDL